MHSSRLLISSRFLAPLGALLAAASVSQAFTLAHRYSFGETGGAGTTLVDSVGTADGTIVGVGGSPAGDGSVGGGQLSLSGGAKAEADYASFPSNIVTNAGAAGSAGDVTIEVWGTHQSAQNWSRVFSFGSATDNVWHMSWTNATNVNANETRFRQEYGGGPGLNTTIQNFGPNPKNPFGTEVHYALVFDDDGGAGGISNITIYRDGIQVNTTDTAIDLNTLGDSDVWLGRSQWGDAGANADYNEFRIYSDTLSASEVSANFAAGPNVVVPEPSGIALIGVAAGLVLLRRRRA